MQDFFPRFFPCRREPPAVLPGVVGLEAGSEVVQISRLRHIDDEPFSFTLNYLPIEIGKRIRAKDLYAVPLLKILQTELRIPIVRAYETIHALPAEPEVAQRLEIVETFYRADKYHYSVNLIRMKRKGKWRWKTEVETSA